MKCIDCNGQGFVVRVGWPLQRGDNIDQCLNCRGSGELQELTIGVGFEHITVFDKVYNSLPIRDIQELLRKKD